MAKMECYVLMNIDTTQSLGLLSAVIWQKEGIRMYEIEGPWDAFLHYSGTIDNMIKFGERIRRTNGVRAAETYLSSNSVAKNSIKADPSALISGYAQPRYGYDESPIDIRELLRVLSKYPQMRRISAIMGGIDLIGEINGSLNEWQVARRTLLKSLPSYVTLETHRVIKYDPSDQFDISSLGEKDRAKLVGKGRSGRTNKLE